MSHPTIEVGAALDRAFAAQLLRDLDRHLRSRPARLTVDLGAVQSFDSTGLGAVVEGMRRARELDVDLRLRGMSQPLLDFFSLLSVDRLVRPAAAAPRLDPVRWLGAQVEPMVDSALAVLDTAGETMAAILLGPLRGRRLRLDRTAAELDHCAGGALPIVALIAFLLGLILAMQAWVQLRVWGAEIYIADMVGVAVLTEIGPLMTAIVLAARTGSSNAAQLGSMVVGEEIDALRQMGIRPIDFLVVPKVVACALSAVALTTIFDVVAIGGGALFSSAMAGIGVGAFEAQLRQALQLSDFLVAAAKSCTFGGVVGIVGCALGLRVQGGSEGIGRATTNAVVLGIFLIVLIDAVFVAAQRLLLA